MIVFLVISLSLGLFVIAFFQQPKFGKLPSGKRLQAIRNSPNYRNGSFQNISETPQLTDTTYFKVITSFLFSDKSHAKPKQQLPSVKTNLHQLDINQDV